ncbi:Bcr/CflA family efflux MFS transporter [bacterium]|nr:Bcr/CflA family efflux MFS transporter [bacterium]
MTIAHLQRVPLYIIMLIVGLPQLSETIYTPSLPAIAAALHTTANAIEHTLTIYLLGFACGVFLWGTLSDRIGRRPGVLAGLGIYTLASIGCFFSSSITMLMIMRFLQAFGASTGSVLGQAIARDSSSLAERGRLFSTVTIGVAFAPALGPVLGTLVASYAGWRAIFIALVLLAGFIALVVSLRLPETHPDAGRHHRFFSLVARCLPQVIRDRRLLACGVLVGAVNGILFGYYAEAPFFFKHMLGVSEGLFGYFSFCTVIPLALGSLLSRWGHGRGFRAESLIRTGIMLMISAALLFYGATLLVDAATLLPLSALCTAGVMTSVMLIIPNVLGTALEPYKQMAGTAASLFGLYYYLWIAAFTGLMAVLHNGTVHRLPLFFLIIGASALVAAQVGIFSKRA